MIYTIIRQYLHIPCTIFIFLIISGCNCKKPPLYLQSEGFIPELEIACPANDLIAALSLQLAKLQKQPGNQGIIIADEKVTNNYLADSLEYFIDILKNTAEEKLEEKIREEFLFYQASGLSSSNNREVLFTGYYEPLFKASLSKTEKYRYPVYKIPDDLVSRHDTKGNKRIGRIAHNRFTEYWSRAEIESANKLKGAEIAYLQDPFDVFTLHVQGSGKLITEDGSLYTVHFAGSNGLEYKSIGRYLVETGRMQLADVTMQSLRDYILKHPDEQKEIFYHNPRYIFFTLTRPQPIKGTLGLPLTPERSIAIDYKTLPWQLPALIDTRIPTFNKQGKLAGYQQFRRFMAAQDTGAAIKGAGRVDIFWGAGRTAENRANYMKEKGRLYFLLKKR